MDSDSLGVATMAAEEAYEKVEDAFRSSTSCTIIIIIITIIMTIAPTHATPTNNRQTAHRDEDKQQEDRTTEERKRENSHRRDSRNCVVTQCDDWMALLALISYTSPVVGR